jgi:hypothetical protein
LQARQTAALGNRAQVQEALTDFDAVADHVVVRAIPHEESLEAYLDVLNVGAPAEDGQRN